MLIVSKLGYSLSTKVRYISSKSLMYFHIFSKEIQFHQNCNCKLKQTIKSINCILEQTSLYIIEKTKIKLSAAYLPLPWSLLSSTIEFFERLSFHRNHHNANLFKIQTTYFKLKLSLNFSNIINKSMNHLESSSPSPA